MIESESFEEGVIEAIVDAIFARPIDEHADYAEASPSRTLALPIFFQIRPDLAAD